MEWLIGLLIGFITGFLLSMIAVVIVAVRITLPKYELVESEHTLDEDCWCNPSVEDNS